MRSNAPIPGETYRLTRMGTVPFTLNSDWIWLLSGSALVYLGCAARARRTGGWQARRTASFLAGIAVLGLAFISPLDNYDVVSLLAHTTQHLLIIFVACPLIAFGAPLSLMHAALPRRLQPLVRRSFGTRPARILLSPLVTWCGFVAGVIATHEPDFFDAALTNSGLHNLEHAVFLVGGFLFWTLALSDGSFTGTLDDHDRIVYVSSAALVFGAADLLSLARSSAASRYYVSLPSPWGGHHALVSQHRAALLVLLACAGIVFVFQTASRVRSVGKPAT